MNTNTNYNQVFTELIKKQILILGPDITVAKVKQVGGIEVDSAGNVTSITGDASVLLQSLINQFVELSGLIVKKTMESILTSQAAGSMPIDAVTAIPTPAVAAPVQTPQAPQVVSQPVATPVQATAAPMPAATTTGAVGEPVVGGATPAPNEDVQELNKMIQDMNEAAAQATGGGK